MNVPRTDFVHHAVRGEVALDLGHVELEAPVRIRLHVCDVNIADMDQSGTPRRPSQRESCSAGRSSLVHSPPDSG